MENRRRSTRILKKSIFDETQPLKLEKYNLWEKRALLTLRKNDQKILETTLFKQSKKKMYWKQKVYRLYPGKLVSYTNEEDDKINAFMILDNVRLEKIKLEEGGNETKYGFRFTHNGKFTEIYARKKEIMLQWYQELKKYCILTTFKYDYESISLIGKGNFAKVYYARSKETGEEFAVKAFQKDKFENIDIDRPALMKEISILRKLNHKHVIKLYEIYENEDYVFLIQEILKGGELFHKLKGAGSHSEEYAAKLMKKLLSALSYIHLKNILHRDLKPENLILRSKNNDYDVCIADFGLADYYNPKGKYMFNRCGTPGYVAPEVLADKIYDFKVDAFSAGVIMFILLTGSTPFKGKSYDTIVLKNYNCTIDFKYKDMHKKLSKEAYDLLQQLLLKDPQQRLSATDALSHPWFDKMLKNEKSQEQLIKLEESIGNNNTKQNGIKQDNDLVTKTPLMGKVFETPQNYASPNSWKRQYKDNKTHDIDNFKLNTNQDPNLNNIEDTPSNGLKNAYNYGETPDSVKSDGRHFNYQQNKAKKKSYIQHNSVQELDDFQDDSDIEDTPVDENMKQLQSYDFSAKLRIGKRNSSNYNSPIVNNDFKNNLQNKQIDITQKQKQNDIQDIKTNNNNENGTQPQSKQIKQTLQNIRNFDQK